MIRSFIRAREVFFDLHLAIELSFYSKVTA